MEQVCETCSRWVPRDCKFSANDGWRCRYWADEWEKAEVHPDGFCVWAERREP